MSASAAVIGRKGMVIYAVFLFGREGTIIGGRIKIFSSFYAIKKVYGSSETMIGRDKMFYV